MIGQTFPDAILLPGGLMRVFTDDGRRWIYENTTLKEKPPSRRCGTKG